jgi:ABC-2 type transport system permease protein
MMGFRVLLLKEIREQVRTARLVAVSVVFIVFGILGPVTDRYMKELIDAVGAQSGGFSVQIPPPTLEGALVQITKNLSQFGIICALLLAMGSVAWEKERGTAGMILTKPASRAAFLAAKLVAISFTLAVAMALGTGVAYVYTWILYPTVFPLGGYIAMAVLMWWILVGFTAITLLGSTITRSAIAAAGIGLVLLVVMGIVGALPVVGPYMPSSLSEPARAIGLGQDPGWLIGPLAFNIVLVPVLFTVTWLVFRRQEL